MFEFDYASLNQIYIIYFFHIVYCKNDFHVIRFENCVPNNSIFKSVSDFLDCLDSSNNANFWESDIEHDDPD